MENDLKNKAMENIWEDCYKMKCGTKRLNYPTANDFEKLTRVPGGWVYIYGNNQGTTSTFVPFDNEFQGLGNALKEE
jgi:hypothetical protein